jgi:hypothetical protein
MAVISTLAVNIIAKTAGFTKGVRGTRKTMMGFNSTIQNTKRLLIGLIAGTGVIRGFKELLRLGSEVTETMSKFNVVFAENAKVMKDWAVSFGESVGRARKDVLSWAAELQDIFVPIGFARSEAMKFAKSLVQVGVDVASFNEKMDREVMRNFTSAIMGSHRAVRQYGIAISESRLAQESYRQGLNKTFSNLTDMEKIFLRYVIIINDTKDAQTDAIRTQDNYANVLKRTRAAITDLATDIGTSLLPVMTGLLKTVQKLIQPLKNMTFETLQASLRVVKVVAGFTAFIIIFPKVVGAIKAIVVGYKALAAGQSIVLALGGPAGWAVLAAGAVIAAAAVVSVNLAFEGLVREMEQVSKETGKFKAAGEQIVVTLDDIKNSLLTDTGGGSGIIESFTKLKNEIAKLKFSEDQLAEFQLQRELGGRARVQDPKLFAELDRLRSELLKLKRVAENVKLGEEIFAETRTPIEKYEAQITKLNELIETGAINWDTYGRAVRDARGKLEGQPQQAGQFDVIRKSLVSVTGLDNMNNPELTEQKKQTRLLEQIAAKETLG